MDPTRITPNTTVELLFGDRDHATALTLLVTEVHVAVDGGLGLVGLRVDPTIPERSWLPREVAYSSILRAELADAATDPS